MRIIKFVREWFHSREILSKVKSPSTINIINTVGNNVVFNSSVYEITAVFFVVIFFLFL
jgi:hypothetical protein